MTNQNDSDAPSSDTKKQSSSDTPVRPVAPQEGQVSEKCNSRSEDEKKVSTELARKFKWVEFAQIGSNIILAIVGIFALCIYNGQLKEMRKATKATKIAAEAASTAASAAQGANELATRTFHADQRAWVSAEVKGKMADGKFTELVGIFVNSGKTPAIGIEYEPSLTTGQAVPVTKNEFAKRRAANLAAAKREDRDPKRSDMMRKEGRVHSQGFVLGPNAQRPFALKFDSLPLDHPGLWDFYQGYMTYKDVFGCEHETWFCYRISPYFEPSACSTENGMN